MPFERSGVPYLLGVSPHRLAYDDVQEHVDFLNHVVTKGYICMHGFTHRTDEHTDKIRTTMWERGGEFAKYETEAELESEWLKGDAILQKLQRYTREHFIPPFNALTQMMVNVLMRKGTRFIHSFDAALCERPARYSSSRCWREFWWLFGRHASSTISSFRRLRMEKNVR